MASVRSPSGAGFTRLSSATRELLRDPERRATLQRICGALGDHVSSVIARWAPVMVGARPYAEVLGGLHHLAISVTPEKWAALRTNLAAAGIDYIEESGVSLYFRDPDGARLELLADPLGEMYGSHVL